MLECLEEVENCPLSKAVLHGCGCCSQVLPMEGLRGSCELSGVGGGCTVHMGVPTHLEHGIARNNREFNRAYAVGQVRSAAGFERGGAVSRKVVNGRETRTSSVYDPETSIVADFRRTSRTAYPRVTRMTTPRTLILLSRISTPSLKY